jgi:hypothetical protein
VPAFFHRRLNETSPVTPRIARWGHRHLIYNNDVWLSVDAAIKICKQFVAALKCKTWQLRAIAFRLPDSVTNARTLDHKKVVCNNYHTFDTVDQDKVLNLFVFIIVILTVLPIKATFIFFLFSTIRTLLCVKTMLLIKNYIIY